ncbi:MAG: Nif3-like dinuclear metal center hexameric protein [Acidobacteriaceae bacterium]|nr:Nif3-like dinuclear metal center hexameric protein [Acidobacteriaceae bacterium]
MDRFGISRRSFLHGGLSMMGGLVSERAQGALTTVSPLTAGQVIERIKANVGIPWQAETVDRLIVGSPDTPVAGIATIMMATLDMLERAQAAGKNMVITHEPTFWSHQDDVSQFKDDPLYKYKLEFVEKNRMAVFHFHDHWHAHKPDGIAAGMSRELGWEKYQDAENPKLFTLPEITLHRLTNELATKLKATTIRVVGDPKLAVRRAIASWGYVSEFPGIPLLAQPDIDVLIAGETREWEVVEYAQDLIVWGKKKALILLGHVVSEQAGMKYCAEWLKGFVTEVPVEYFEEQNPFWTV